MTARSLIVGFKFVFASPIILGTITLDLFAVLLGGATALLPIYAKDILEAGPTGLGFLQAALPAGSLLCALVLAHRPPLAESGTDDAFGRGRVRAGDDRVWFLALVLVLLFHALRLRRDGQHQRRGAAHTGATAHAR